MRGLAEKETLDDQLSRLRLDRDSPPATSPPGRLVRWVVVSAALFVVVAAVLVVASVTRAVPVEVARVQVSRGTSAGDTVLTASGYIVAHHRIDLGSKVMGRVAWIGIEKGDQVREGQILVRLEDTEFRAQHRQAQASLAVAEARLRELEAGSRPQEIAAARAAVDESEANYRDARSDFERIENLHEAGIASPQQLEDARRAFDVAQAQLESTRKNTELVELGPRLEQIDYARAEVAQRQAAVDYAQTMLDATRIRSPINGTVLDRLVERGGMVTTMFAGERGAQSAVASLADLNDLQVELDISQDDFARLEMNQKAVVVADAYPDREYEGELVEMAPEANRQKATVQVKVQVLKPDEYLRPEMNARASFVAERKPGASENPAPRVFVPRSAVIDRDGGRVVYVVKGSRVEMKTVRPGRVSSAGLEILNGLTGTETVVVKGGEALNDGSRIQVQ